MFSAEYIWLDGTTSKELRSKTRVLSVDDLNDYERYEIGRAAEHLPPWSFDGSSTEQAPPGLSDCILQPVCVVSDPIRGGDSILVLCEVLDLDGAPHKTNTRATLFDVLVDTADTAPWFGFEQEYTFMKYDRREGSIEPLGFQYMTTSQLIAANPQGQFYCGVGAENVYGREIVEEHLQACIDAKIQIYGLNAEVMPGQWEFQIGPRGKLHGSPLRMSDHLYLARWLLKRIAEKYGVIVSLASKPVKGWNGAGLHTNFSNRHTRKELVGINAINEAILKLEANHDLHIENYGEGIKDRLTGEHETCSWDEFKSGNSDRGASIRIPPAVKESGKGYFEDRRPNANADPYTVCALILSTIGTKHAISTGV